MLCQGVALVRQHIDGVARASSAGTKSGSSARSLVLLTMLVPVSRSRTVEHGGSARARRRIELGKIADLEVPPAAAFRVAPPSAICANFQRQRAPADPRLILQ